MTDTNEKNENKTENSSSGNQQTNARKSDGPDKSNKREFKMKTEIPPRKKGYCDFKSSIYRKFAFSDAQSRLKNNQAT